ncbi:hypothetical protein GS429_08425 [Natronorubrum sp. JWXQ-INN-674]|uniref:Serine protease n=1 Tax=Natronorubrum halalkaliphilum TaxID=2691917 RepID=A0A6B0VLR8_9EURY|nr:hypothetical protein [Natronorubrum halalkaliphilum]MXV62085.1 hypothetical protein [Natronorubrum halalkaliphilum]
MDDIDIPRERRDQLLEFPNVIGHGIGREKSGGEYTGDIVVVAYVDEKVPERELNDEDVLPDEFDGTAVDVQPEGAEPIATGDYENYEPRGNRDEEIRPFAGGVEIGDGEGDPWGTAGAVVELDGEVGFISNNHVLCDDETDCTGREVFQPADVLEDVAEDDDLELEDYRVGEVTSLGDIDPDGPDDENLDFGFVTLEEDVEVGRYLFGMKEVDSFGESNFDERFLKTGVRTGLSSGLLEATDVTIDVEYDHGSVTVTGVDKYLTNVAPGDSGSIIGRINASGNFEMTGLTFAAYYEDEAHDLSPALYAHPVSAIEDAGFELGPADVEADVPDGGDGDAFIEISGYRTAIGRGEIRVRAIASNTGGTDWPSSGTIVLIDAGGETIGEEDIDIDSGRCQTLTFDISDDYEGETLRLEALDADGALVDEDLVLGDAYLDRFEPLGPGYTIYLTRGGDRDPDSEHTAVLGPDDVIDPSLPGTHTDIDEWECYVPLTRELEDWRLAEMFVVYETQSGDSELIYRGRLDTVNHDKGSDLTTLRGESVEYKLDQGSAQKHYQGEAAANALEEYWAEETPFEAVVHEPDPNVVDEGKIVQSASSTADLENLFNWDEADRETLPVDISDGTIELLQTCYVLDLEGGYSDDQYSGGEADGPNTVPTVDFDYTIPAEHLHISLREGIFSGNRDVRVRFDGTDLYQGIGVGSNDQPSWWHLSNLYDIRGGDDSDGGSFLLEYQDSSDGQYVVDVVVIYDRRYHNSDDFDDELHEPGGYFDRPYLYPPEYTFESAIHDDPYNTTAADLVVSATGINDNFSVELSNNGGDSYPIGADGTNSVSGSFGNTFGSLVRSRLTLGAYPIEGNPQDATPRYGYNSQAISSYELEITTNDLGIFNDREFVGSDFEIQQDLHDEAGYRWVAEYDDEEFLVTSFPRGGIVEEDVDWTTLEGVSDGFEMRDYANVITIYGAYDEDNEEYLVAEARAEEEIQRLIDLGFSEEEAEIEDSEIEPDIDNPEDLRQIATRELANRVREDEREASIPIVPKAIDPGKSYPVPDIARPGEEPPVLPLESIDFSDGQDPSGELHFESRTDISTVVRTVSRDVRRTRSAIR